MALSSVRITLPVSESDGQVTVPVSSISDWATIIDAPGLATADAATIVNPATEIVTSTTHLLVRDRGVGTTLLLRIKYPSAATLTTDAKVKVFGRVRGTDGSVGGWSLLRNRSGSISRTIPIDTTNNQGDGTSRWTTPDWDQDAWDCQGCNEFLVGIETALNLDSNNENSATLEAKII